MCGNIISDTDFKGKESGPYAAGVVTKRCAYLSRIVRESEQTPGTIRWGGENKACVTTQDWFRFDNSLLVLFHFRVLPVMVRGGDV